jgi:cysteine desulfurase family protein (TIGR01976 family)
MLDVDAIRARFPALSRQHEGCAVVFADAPGGTQVPVDVIDAIAAYLRTSNANAHGAFPTSEETDAVIAEARRAGADLLGARPDEVVFGPNATTSLFHLARSIAATLGPGDEVVVTRLDHDANVRPWTAAARISGATVRWLDVRDEDVTLNLDGLDRVLGPRTRLVAVTVASNAVGSVVPVAEVAGRAHEHGALVVADAVHAAQHRAIDVAALGADVLVCSPYKVFGPHLGVWTARRELLARWTPDKVRPSPDVAPERWETGTQNHEALAGFVAAVDYLAGLGRGGPTGPAAGSGAGPGGRRSRLLAAFDAIVEHEAALSRRFLEGAATVPGLRLFGIADPARAHERTPTFAVRIGDRPPVETSKALADRGIYTWDGNYYAVELMERLGLEATGGAVRIGFCHYHTAEEVDRVVEALAAIAPGG